MRLSRTDVPPLYAITDYSRTDPSRDLVSELITAGVKWIQVRMKGSADLDFYETVRRAAGTLPAKVKLFVNDRLDIALACMADGVHLGDRDLPVGVARQVAGQSPILIGYSTHSVEDAIGASRDGTVDYVAIGPIFRSPTKNVRPPLGVEVIEELRGKTEKPIVAVGGIDHTRIQSVLSAGADAAAVISALYDGGSISDNVKRLLDAVDR